MSSDNPFDLAPELLLLAGALASLLLGLFTPRLRQGRVVVLAAAAVTASLATAVWQWRGATRYAFSDTYRVDALTGAVRVIVGVALLLSLLLLRQQPRRHPRETEAYVLLLLAGLGAITLAGANDLLLLVAGFSLASVPLYALVGFGKDAGSTEAAMKYYLLGALFGLLLLAGVTMLFGLAGRTGYSPLAAGLAGAPRLALVAGVLALVAGLCFKAGAVPAHFWVPDVAAGTAPAVAAIVTTVPKVGALAAFFRLFDGPLQSVAVDWRLLLAVSAVASMTLGNLAAFFQTDPRRLLGYSSISQIGYLLLPMVVAGRSGGARDALVYYLAGYALTNIGAFAVVAALPGARTLADYRGLARARPALFGALVVCLLGLVGTPPVAVFVGKLAAFTVAIDGGYTWLAVVAALNTVASVFYYLRWIVPAVSAGAPLPAPAASARLSRVTAYSAATATLLLGLLAGAALGLRGGAA